MITALYAGLLALGYAYLTTLVIKRRRKVQKALGDGEDISLKQRIRAHGNFAEYSPIFIILLGFAEHGGLHSLLVHLFGIVFIFGRISHFHSLTNVEKYEADKLVSNVKFRVIGMVITINCLIFLGILNILQFIF